MPDTPNNRVGPQPGASLCVWCDEQQRRTPGKGALSVHEKAEQWRKSSQRGLLITSWQRLGKKTDGVITPVAEAVRVPALCHFQGPHGPSSCAPFTLNPHWARAATGKKSLVSKYAGSLRSYPALCDTVDYGLVHSLDYDRLPCQWGSPGKNTGVGCHILLELCTSTVLAANLPKYQALLRPWHPSICTTNTPGHHWVSQKSSRAASGESPSGQPTCRGGDKTTIETQGQCG